MMVPSTKEMIELHKKAIMARKNGNLEEAKRYEEEYKKLSDEQYAKFEKMFKCLHWA